MKPSFTLLAASMFMVSSCSYQQQGITPSETSGKHAIPLKEVRCSAMPVSSDKLRFTTRLDQGSWVALSSGNSPFVAYSLPQGTSQINIQSLPLHASKQNKAEIFAPEAALMDRNNQVIRTIKSFKYKKPGFISQESLSATIKLNHIEDQHAACLLIYTTDEARSANTVLMNEAKEYARVRSVVAPPVPDIVARHGYNGELNLSLKISETPPLTPALPVAAPQPVPDSFNDAMKSHFLDGTRQAIAENNVKKALSLRSEFNNIIQNIEAYFISQFGRDKDKTIQPTAPLEDEGFADKVIYHYQSETYRYLTTGQTSSALRLQDSLKHMQHQLDVIFDQK